MTDDKNKDKNKDNNPYYGRHVTHRTSWLDIANKKLDELDGKSIYEYVQENTDLKDPSMFLASMFEEGVAAKIYNDGKIKRDGVTRSNLSDDYNYPYSGYFDFGIDNIGGNLDKFIEKGYLSDDIRDNLKLIDSANEKGDSIVTADIKSFKDVIDLKLAYLKDSEDQMNSYLEKNPDIQVSDDAKEYFKYVGYNAGVGNAQKMMRSYNDKGHLKDDKFLQDDFKPEYWKDPYNYSMRRWQGADMLRNEIGSTPIERTYEDPITAKKLTPIEIARRKQNPINSPGRTLDNSLAKIDPTDKVTDNRVRRNYINPVEAKDLNLDNSINKNIKGKVTDNRVDRNYVNPIDAERIGLGEFDKPIIDKNIKDNRAKITMLPEYTIEASRLAKVKERERKITSPNTMPEHTVEGSYIPDAIDTSMLKKRNIKNMRNPISTEDFFLGGLLGNSVGGKTAGGALNGAMSGAALGPPGMIAGGLMGAISSFFGAKKQNKLDAQADAQASQAEFSNYIASSGLNQNNGSNIPMAQGGKLESGGVINPLFTEFNEGGSHESNPLGGVPQGMNSQTGQMRTVEEGETKFKFDDGEYVFSNRISPLKYEF